MNDDQRLATRVVTVGDMADAFHSEGIMVLFGEDAPEELRDVAVVHRPSINAGGISVEDLVTITHGDDMTSFRVLAVGHVANENLVNLGHLVLKRNGETTPALPGDVCCEAGDLPQVGPGDRLVVRAGTLD